MLSTEMVRVHMYPGIDLRLQYYVVVVAENLSFTRAADILHIAQPALSRSIRQVEESLGVKLFERTSRKVVLTEAGKIFVTEARQAISHSSRAVELPKLVKTPDKLVIGYPTHLDVRHVLQLSMLSAPGVRILQFVYCSSPMTEILDGIRSRTIDCGLITLPDEYPEILDYPTARLFRHQLGIALPKGHRLARKRNLQLGDLKEEPLIFVAKAQDQTLGVWLERRCRSAGFVPRIVQEVRHPHDYSALILHNVGIGIGFDFNKTWFTKGLSSNLVLRAFSDRQLEIETAVMFGDKFHFKPLSGYVTAVTKFREKWERNAPPLRLSA